MRMTIDHETFDIAALPAAGSMAARITEIVMVTRPTSQLKMITESAMAMSPMRVGI